MQFRPRLAHLLVEVARADAQGRSVWIDSASPLLVRRGGADGRVERQVGDGIVGLGRADVGALAVAGAESAASA